MSRGPGWPKGWRFPVAKVAAGTHEDHVLRRALYVVGGAVFVLGYWGWHLYEPSLAVFTCAYRTLLLFFVDDSGAVAPPWPLNVARFVAPFVTAAATIALFLTATRRRLQASTARRAAGHIVLVGAEERTTPYAEDLTGAMRVHVGPERDAPGPGLIHVQGSWDRAHWVDAASVADAELVVLAAGDDSVNLAAFDAVMATWSAAGPGAVHLELGDRSTATWLALSLARTHPDRSIEVCCFEEGLARQAVEEVISGLPEVDLEGVATLPRFAVFGDGREVPLLVHQLARALSVEHHRRGGALPELVLVECPKGPEILGRLSGLSGQVSTRLVDRLADLVAGTDRGLVAIVSHADPDRRLQVAAELSARRLDADVYVLDRRRFEALRIKTLDPSAAHGTGALDGAFARSAKAMVEDLHRMEPDTWDAWSELTSEQRSRATAWVRTAVAALLDPGPAPVGGAAWTVDLPPSSLPPDPLTGVAAQDLVSRVGEPHPDDPPSPTGDAASVPLAVARRYGDLPVWVFDACDLYIAPEEGALP